MRIGTDQDMRAYLDYPLIYVAITHTAARTSPVRAHKSASLTDATMKPMAQTTVFFNQMAFLALSRRAVIVDGI